MNKLYQICFALLFMFVACRQDEQGMISPQGVTVVNTTGASNLIVTNWQTLSWNLTERSITNPNGYVLDNAFYLAKVPVEALTKETINNAVMLTYIRYIGEKDIVRIELVDGDPIYGLKNTDIKQLSYIGIREKEVLFGSRYGSVRNSLMYHTVEAFLQLLNAEKLETRTFIIQNKTARLAAIDFQDYAKVCQTLNINQ